MTSHRTIFVSRWQKNLVNLSVVSVNAGRGGTCSQCGRCHQQHTRALALVKFVLPTIFFCIHRIQRMTELASQTALHFAAQAADINDLIRRLWDMTGGNPTSPHCWNTRQEKKSCELFTSEKEWQLCSSRMCEGLMIQCLCSISSLTLMICYSIYIFPVALTSRCLRTDFAYTSKIIETIRICSIVEIKNRFIFGINLMLWCQLSVLSWS